MMELGCLLKLLMLLMLLLLMLMLMLLLRCRSYYKGLAVVRRWTREHHTLHRVACHDLTIRLIDLTGMRILSRV
ncbi:hypothetical protein BC939DRAFT_467763, partial [Gamsiella multidivaricata]|uniref:uncharacterized protein n=1 Tax=Gamsiella multidivaricata TaxID=101098 RepID=UPI00221E4DB8